MKKINLNEYLKATYGLAFLANGKEESLSSQARMMASHNLVGGVRFVLTLANYVSLVVGYCLCSLGLANSPVEDFIVAEAVQRQAMLEAQSKFRADQAAAVKSMQQTAQAMASIATPNQPETPTLNG